MTVVIKTKKPNNRQTLLFHLLELRSRIFHYIITLLVVSLLAYTQHEKILKFIVLPLNQPLFYSTPTGAFDSIVKVCLFTGFILTIPVLIYQILSFVTPTISTSNKKTLIKIIISSCVSMVIGIGFAFFVTLPAALKFLNTFGTSNIHSLITTDAYLNFIVRYLLGFGIYFQLPIVLWIIDSIHPLPLKILFSAQRWVILISVIFAAVITPTPDIINLALMAVPCIILYQISVVVLWLIHRKKLTIQPQKFKLKKYANSKVIKQKNDPA